MSMGQLQILNFMGDNAICTVWSNNGEDRYGQVSYSNPRLIKAEAAQKSGLTRNLSGSEITFTAIFTSEYDNDTNSIKEGDRIIFGDLSTDTNPILVGAYEVLAVHVFSGILPTDKPDIKVHC